MSDSTRERPPRTIDTDDVCARLEGEGVDHATAADGRVRADDWRGEVSLGLHVSDNNEWPVETSSDFDRDTARDICHALRSGTDGQWTTDSASIILNFGWLYYDSPTGTDGDGEATVTLSHSREETVLEVTYRSPEGTVSVDTVLTDDECSTIAAALGAAADAAEEWEPRNVESRASEAKPWWKGIARNAVSLGIGSGVVLGVAGFVMPRVAQDVTVNGEPLAAPSPGFLAAFVLLVAILFLAIQYAPRRMNGGWHR